jgi:hypothetical protein
MNARNFGLEGVISRLVARRVGSAATGIKALAGLVRDPCPRCGGRRFETSPVFPVPQRRRLDRTAAAEPGPALTPARRGGVSPQRLIAAWSFASDLRGAQRACDDPHHWIS